MRPLKVSKYRILQQNTSPLRYKIQMKYAILPFMWIHAGVHNTEGLYPAHGGAVEEWGGNIVYWNTLEEATKYVEIEKQARQKGQGPWTVVEEVESVQT
tara:strand:+ start:541 stop:837 length:297 start_codon:yes stop_codon:yes gene_type:complete